MRLPKRSLLLFATFFMLAQARAETTAPDILVKNVTNEVLQIIRTDKDIQAGSNKKAIELIEARVLPHFNFTHMTKLAVGRNWKIADAAQQTRLTDAFRILLVRTYAKALIEYKDQTIGFKPFKMTGSETEVKVRTQVSQEGGGKPIALDYYLEKAPMDWMVNDIEVDGVSLVVIYRQSFAAEISSGGVDGLIKSLQDKNKTGPYLSKH